MMKSSCRLGAGERSPHFLTGEAIDQDGIAGFGIRKAGNKDSSMGRAGKCTGSKQSRLGGWSRPQTKASRLTPLARRANRDGSPTSRLISV